MVDGKTSRYSSGVSVLGSYLIPFSFVLFFLNLELLLAPGNIWRWGWFLFSSFFFLVFPFVDPVSLQ